MNPDPHQPHRPAHHLALGLIHGALAGLLAFAFDQVAARLTAGYWVPLELRWTTWYVFVGAAVGTLTACGQVLFRRLGEEHRVADGQATGRQLFSASLALLYLAPIVERILHALAGSPLAAGGAALLAAGGYVVWWRLLHVLLSRETCWMSGLIAGLCAAVGLSINRNLIASAFESRALLADFAVLALGLLLVGTARRFGPVRTLTAAGLLPLAALALADGEEPLRPRETASPRDDAPHVILLVIDTLRQDVFSDVVANTPEGRRFAEAMSGSAWFSRAIAAAPWTAPSMGSILTGLYPREHGFVKPQHHPEALLTRLSPEVPRLPEELAEIGYRSAAWIANPILHEETGMAQGFDRYTVLAAATTKLPVLAAAARFGWIEPFAYQNGAQLRRRARQGIQSLQRDAGDAPLFLWLHWMDPHGPLRTHPDLPPIQETVTTATGSDSQPDPPNALETLYRNEVRYTLEQVSRTIEDLRSAGVWDDALVVLVADHGEMLPSDRRDRRRYPKSYGHGHALFDELVNVPLVIRPPGGIDGVRRNVDALAHHTDLFDTVLDVVAGAPASRPRIGADRVSLAPWLSQESPRRRRRMAMSEGMHSGREQRSVRTLQWKWIDHLDPEERDELYQLARDPRERRNLIDHRPKPARRLRDRLLQLIDTLRPPPALDAVELDAETRRQLEALGYL